MRAERKAEFSELRDAADRLARSELDRTRTQLAAARKALHRRRTSDRRARVTRLYSLEAMTAATFAIYRRLAEAKR